MGERAKNVAVGLTVIVALMMLGFMILLFTGVPALLQRGYDLDIQMDATYEIHEGDPIYLKGMRIGRVVSVGFTQGDPVKGITLRTRIDRNIRLPGNIVAYVFTKGLMGAPYLTLSNEGPHLRDKHGKEYEFLPTDRVITLQAIHRGSDLLPPELTDGLKSLAKVAEGLSSMFEEAPPAAASGPASRGATTASAPSTPPMPGGMKGTLARLNQALDDFHAVLGNTENQKNLKTSLANLATLTAKATETVQAVQGVLAEAGKNFGEVSRTIVKTGQDADALTKKLMDDAERISALLASMNQVIVKMNQGEGTAGKLLNDPKLYNSLVDAAEQLGKLMVDFRQLAEEWKKSGVPLKLK